MLFALVYSQPTGIVHSYGLMQSFGNLGPGDMLGLVSAESFATAVRGTCYGLSAAIGKTGAAVGTQAFTPIQNNLGKKYVYILEFSVLPSRTRINVVSTVRWTFIIAAICGVAGILTTYFFVPDMTGIDLAEEDREFMQYLRDNGWEGEIGEDDDEHLVDDESSVEGKVDEKQ